MKLLLYCCKAKPYLADFKGDYQTYSNGKELDELFDKGFNPNDIMNILNGKIVAECDFEAEEIYISKSYGFPRNIEIIYTDSLRQPIYLSQKSCLKLEDISEYLNHKGGYAIHIKNLHIFDKPRELSDYYNLAQNDKPLLAKAMQKVGIWEIYDPPVNGPEVEHFVGKFFIPVHSEELRRILNKEQTVLVRKRVLKEMLE